MAEQLTRRSLLKTSAVASLAAVAGGLTLPGCTEMQLSSKGAPMATFKPKAKDVIKVGFVGIGNQGSGHVNNLLKIEGCKLVAVCDIRPERVEWAKKRVVDSGQPEPKCYGDRGDLDFQRMCATEDLDLVYNAAPWRWHTPICMSAMQNGKNAASEVNIALSLEDCWKLVETSEKTKKHCVMQENCCYDHAEMIVLNMIQQGLFGEMMYGECGYLHDLRALKISPTYYQGMWRVYQSLKRNGNLYPTHGIGPMAWCMDINRGDAFDTLVSMSTKAIGLNEFAEKKYAEATNAKDKAFYNQWRNRDYALGDFNVSLIKTKKGKVIVCKHNTNLPRPYSRAFLVQGSKGLYRKYPRQLIHLEDRSPAHAWEDFSVYSTKYDHPVWKAMQEKSRGAGHGGMDFIEDYRLINALRRGLTPDIDVYDSVTWSSIIALSAQSIKEGNSPVKFPDFTRGLWKQSRKLGVSQWYA